MAGCINYEAKSTREVYYGKIESYLILCEESRLMGQIYNCLEEKRDLPPNLKNIYKEYCYANQYQFKKSWFNHEDDLRIKLKNIIKTGNKLGLKIDEDDAWEFEALAQDFQKENQFRKQVITKVRELKEQAKTMRESEKPAMTQPILDLCDLVQWHKETS